MPSRLSRYLDTVAMFVRDQDLQHLATGFFCRHRTRINDAFDGSFLVTCARAVGKDLRNTHLLCVRQHGKHARWYPATGEGGLALGSWISDPDRDLAVLHLDRERLAADSIRCREFDADYSALPTLEMRRRRIGEGDDVRILGFAPLGPTIPLQPLMRRGIIARVQDCYRGRSDTFLLDATIGDGSPGSPVIMLPERGVDGRRISQPSVKLVGVISGYLPSRAAPLRIGDDGKTLLVQPNTGLVRVVPVDGLLELLETAAKRAGA